MEPQARPPHPRIPFIGDANIYGRSLLRQTINCGTQLMKRAKGKSQKKKTRESHSVASRDKSLGVLHGGALSLQGLSLTPEDDMITNEEMKKVYRLIAKKDSTTRLKALEDLNTLFQHPKGTISKAELDVWGIKFRTMWQDASRQVRGQALLVMQTLFQDKDCRKRMDGTFLQSVIPRWYQLHFDTSSQVVATATATFQTIFDKPKRRSKALLLYSPSILRHLFSIVSKEEKALSDPRVYSTDEICERFERLVSSALGGLASLVAFLDSQASEETQELVNELQSCLTDAELLRLTQIKNTVIRRALFAFLAQASSSSVLALTKATRKRVQSVLCSPVEPASHRWNALLCFTQHQAPWESLDHNLVWQRIEEDISDPGRGSTLCSYVLELFTVIDNTQDQLQFLTTLMAALKRSKGSQVSQSILQAFWSTFSQVDEETRNTCRRQTLVPAVQHALSTVFPKKRWPLNFTQGFFISIERDMQLTQDEEYTDSVAEALLNAVCDLSRSSSSHPILIQAMKLLLGVSDTDHTANSSTHFQRIVATLLADGAVISFDVLSLISPLVLFLSQCSAADHESLFRVFAAGMEQSARSGHIEPDSITEWARMAGTIAIRMPESYQIRVSSCLDACIELSWIDLNPIVTALTASPEWMDVDGLRHFIDHVLTRIRETQHENDMPSIDNIRTSPGYLLGTLSRSYPTAKALFDTVLNNTETESTYRLVIPALIACASDAAYYPLQLQWSYAASLYGDDMSHRAASHLLCQVPSPNADDIRPICSTYIKPLALQEWRVATECLFDVFPYVDWKLSPNVLQSILHRSNVALSPNTSMVYRQVQFLLSFVDADVLFPSNQAGAGMVIEYLVSQLCMDLERQSLDTALDHPAVLQLDVSLLERCWNDVLEDYKVSFNGECGESIVARHLVSFFSGQLPMDQVRSDLALRFLEGQCKIGEQMILSCLGAPHNLVSECVSQADVYLASDLLLHAIEDVSEEMLVWNLHRFEEESDTIDGRLHHARCQLAAAVVHRDAALADFPTLFHWCSNGIVFFQDHNVNAFQLSYIGPVLHLLSLLLSNCGPSGAAAHGCVKERALALEHATALFCSSIAESMCVPALKDTLAQLSEIVAKRASTELHIVETIPSQTLFDKFHSEAVPVAIASFNILTHRLCHHANCVPDLEEDSIDKEVEFVHALLPQEFISQLLLDKDECQTKQGFLLTWCLLLDVLEVVSAIKKEHLSNFLRWPQHYTSRSDAKLKHADIYRRDLVNDVLQYLLVDIQDTTSSPTLRQCHRIEEEDLQMHTTFTRLGSKMYLRLLRHLPSFCRNWWNACSRSQHQAVKDITAMYFSPVLIDDELECLMSSAEPSSSFRIQSVPSRRSTFAEYSDGELTVRISLQLSACYPLELTEVTCPVRSGIKEKKVRQWRLMIAARLSNSTILDSFVAWKRNVESHFDGVEECPICYSIVHATNNSLPKFTCRTCRKKFHSACMYTWFSSSQANTCPMCRNVF